MPGGRKRVALIWLGEVLALLLFFGSAIRQDHDGILLGILALVLFLLVGGLSIVYLLRYPLQNQLGRWGVKIGILFTALNLAATLGAAIWTRSGNQISESTGQYLELGALVLLFTSVGLGVSGREKDWRGLLLMPALLGVFALNFLLGNLLIQR